METRERWETLVTLARATQRTNGSLWEGRLAKFADAIQAADDELAAKNRALRETVYRLDTLLWRGDLDTDPNDVAITRAWLKRVRRAIRGTSTAGRFSK